MKKGVIFTIDAAYALTAVFIVVVVFLSFITFVEQPNYDLIQEIKIAHDMGEENTSNASTEEYGVGDACIGKKSAVILNYYDYDGATTKEVCKLK
ncbi:MAG: hypothetical protein J7K68_03185 [Candidatus Diapherotrites archaeon]|nr:hypothetical protein [Candidatus Diapherotrites archaeon]